MDTFLQVTGIIFLISILISGAWFIILYFNNRNKPDIEVSDADYCLRCKVDSENEIKSLENTIEHQAFTITKLANESADKDSTIAIQKETIDKKSKMIELINEGWSNYKSSI